MHSITSYTSNAHTNVVVMYVIAMFITSDDASLRILSMTLYNIVTFIMIGLTFTSVILSGKLSFRLLPELKWLYLTLIWIVISLVASKVMDSKTMLDEVYNYQWATGVNSPELRGISFTVRFILSLFVIQFIISSINTREKYVTVMKYFLWMVCIFALFPLLQIILISIFNIEIGNIYYERSAIRIGGYVGEPSVLAGMLCCGLFSIVATILFKNNIISFNKHFLMVFLGIIIIDLYMTSSTSIITAIMLSVIIFARKYLSKKSIILAIILIITLPILAGWMLYDKYK